MKIFVEFESDSELDDFLAWRERKKMLQKYSEDAERFSKVEIASIEHWPDWAKSICRQEKIDTVSQAEARSDTEWLKTPNFGKAKLAKLRSLIQQHKTP